jgi:2,4-dienoyl-CoA reductase-like NADH-dependent reductase (Old Yellow Enzyme family)
MTQIYQELYPHLFEPLTIKKTTFRNRIFSPPNLLNAGVDKDGFLTEAAIVYFANKAKVV